MTGPDWERSDSLRYNFPLSFTCLTALSFFLYNSLLFFLFRYSSPCLINFYHILDWTRHGKKSGLKSLELLISFHLMLIVILVCFIWFPFLFFESFSWLFLVCSWPSPISWWDAGVNDRREPDPFALMPLLQAILFPSSFSFNFLFLLSLEPFISFIIIFLFL